ncbi:MAG: phage/plasmid primase, P4 family [Pleurocapsa sp. MO_226.B13]|nr:phage/plasmid primase, P4 family [Pleurocapsa sp. MO_226.B13]
MISFVAPFKILDYLDRLKVVKETSSEYHCLCPVCGDGGFKVNKKDGKYHAFKCGCEVKDIREAISPWSEVIGQSPQREHPSRRIKLAQLPSPASDRPIAESKEIPTWQQEQGIPPNATETRYWYSKTQWVSRFDWKTPSGKEKTIRQGHIKSNGLIQWTKGSKEWRAYKLSEAVKYCQDKWVLGLEGEGCVETARAIALSAITWQGSNWKEKAITSDLTKLIKAGAAGLVYFPDRDSAGEKKAELVKSACKQVNLPCLILSPTDIWGEMPVKGDISDWAKAHPNICTKQLAKQLDRAIALAYQRNSKQKQKQAEAAVKDTASHKKRANLPDWSQSDLADWLAEKYQGKLAWNSDKQSWYVYGSVTKGIWSVGSTERIGRLVKSELKSAAREIAKAGKKKPSYTISFVNGVTALLKLDLEVDQWEEAEGLLPMLNGVLDLETRKLLPHSPQNRLTWCLPYEYDVLARCEPIQEWLLTMCGGDRNLVQLMRAYLLGIVTGRTDWQKYLELIGPGGTGKSTLTRLATALVGQENVHTTTLQKLEKSKFETASIAGKRLVLINDSERYAGDVTKLKNLTGQDTLPYEVKFQQSKGGFTPDALVIVSTNEVIQSTDYTSGLARRRISVPFSNKIKGKRQKNLIEHKNGQMRGEFLPYIPGLLNWVLEMDEDTATEIVKNYEENVPSLLAMKAKTLVETNPIADWLDNFIVYDAEAKTNVGVAKRDKDGLSPFWYLDTDKWLYPNYCEYCHNSGTKAVSLRRFVNLLSDLGNNQLDLDISRERDRSGSYFVGLKIRDDFDDSPPLVTVNTSVVIDKYEATDNTNVIKTKEGADSTNVINCLWGMVMNKLSDVMDYVMDKSIDGDGCDGSDSNFEKSSKNCSLVESPTESNTKKGSETECSQIDSPPKDNETGGQTEQGDQDELSAIAVGDRVTISDCPGHWATIIYDNYRQSSKTIILGTDR